MFYDLDFFTKTYKQQKIIALYPHYVTLLNFLYIGNLKITDFGLSTMFKYKGKERKLERCCGTPPYVAPEVPFKEGDQLFCS